MPSAAELAQRICNVECDAQVQAAKIVAESNFAIATAIDNAVKTFAPAADAVAHLSDAQKKLCNFLVKHRLKLAASVPFVLTAVGAISPNAAKMLHDVIVATAAHL